jgi:hypothetical protein
MPQRRGASTLETPNAQRALSPQPPQLSHSPAPNNRVEPTIETDLRMNKPSSLVPCTHGLLAHCVEEGPNSNSRSADDPARGQESQGYVPWQDEAEPQSSDTESRSSAPALRGGPSGAAEAKAVALPTQSLGFVVEKDELEGFPGRDVVRRRATAVFYNACVAVLGRSGSTPVTAPDRHRDSSQGRGRDARNPPNENVSRTPPPQHRAQRLYKNREIPSGAPWPWLLR